MTDKVEDTLELWEIDKIIPYDKNPKLHSTEHVNKLAANIREVGFTQPIVVDKDGVIIAGHGRRMAAMRIGMKFVPVRVMRTMTPEKVKAARLSDNRLVSQEYDNELEQLELTELANMDIDLTVLGYDERELEFLTEDLAVMDMGSLVTDLNSEVKKQTEKTETRAAEVEEEKIAIGEAFGFKTVTVEQARHIGIFMGEIEQDTGLKGAAALEAFVLSLINVDK